MGLREQDLGGDAEGDELVRFDQKESKGLSNRGQQLPGG